MSEANEKFELCQRFARQLGEHFDAVQLLVTWTEDGQSHVIKFGSGNWYARVGMAHEFLETNVAENTAHSIAEHLRANEE